MLVIGKRALFIAERRVSIATAIPGFRKVRFQLDDLVELFDSRVYLVLGYEHHAGLEQWIDHRIVSAHPDTPHRLLRDAADQWLFVPQGREQKWNIFHRAHF